VAIKDKLAVRGVESQKSPHRSARVLCLLDDMMLLSFGRSEKGKQKKSPSEFWKVSCTPKKKTKKNNRLELAEKGNDQ
jgi:hypothetical protein